MNAPFKEKDNPQEAYVIAKCAVCGHERKIVGGEIRDGDYPMCPNDGLPLIAERAVVERRKGGRNA